MYYWLEASFWSVGAAVVSLEALLLSLHHNLKTLIFFSVVVDWSSFQPNSGWIVRNDQKNATSQNSWCRFSFVSAQSHSCCDILWFFFLINWFTLRGGRGLLNGPMRAGTGQLLDGWDTTAVVSVVFCLCVTDSSFRFKLQISSQCESSRPCGWKMNLRLYD